MMRKLKLALSIVGVWLALSALYAYYYVVTILAHAEEYDAYARNRQFQLLMFSLVRLPYLVLILCILMAAVLVLPARNKPADASVLEFFQIIPGWKALEHSP